MNELMLSTSDYDTILDDIEKNLKENYFDANNIENIEINYTDSDWEYFTDVCTLIMTSDYDTQSDKYVYGVQDITPSENAEIMKLMAESFIKKLPKNEMLSTEYVMAQLFTVTGEKLHQNFEDNIFKTNS